MKRAFVCTGILGGGTALVFALALLVAVLFPQGALIPASWNGGFMRGGLIAPMGGGVAVEDVVMSKDVFVAPDAIPVPAPAIDVPPPVPASIESAVTGS